MDPTDQADMVVDKYGRPYGIAQLEKMDEYITICCGLPVNQMLKPITRASSIKEVKEVSDQAVPTTQSLPRLSRQNSPKAVQKRQIKDHMLVGELGLQLLKGTKNGLTVYEGSSGSYFQLLKDNKKADASGCA